MALRIGYFEHWLQPPYKFVDFLREQGYEITKIDYSRKDYLENYDVALIEQNGFNDYIENDELYIQDWVKRGGILLFMHQDYQRWAPYFLPHEEVGYTQLIHRYVPTIGGGSHGVKNKFTEETSAYMTYMMPWIEEPGRRLFSEPEVITPDEMLDWRLEVETFGILRRIEEGSSRKVRTAAQSCYLVPDNWEVLGSFMDPAVRDGALILRAKYGEGMYFCNQLLFPEILTEEAGRCIAFWKKYIKNLFAYCERFKNGESEEMPAVKKELPLKKNYKMPIHMHSLDWYGCDSQPGTINAIMRYMGWDICTLAVKDNAPYAGKLDTDKYSDDKVLFLDGQEYHPFNWNDKYDHLSHNTYHMLAMGIDKDAYTPRFTRSFFSDEEIAAYLEECVAYVHDHGGAICATHPNVDYWSTYDVDGVDKEPQIPLAGTDIEKNWLNGKHFGIMNSVDLFGFRRIFDNPAVNFLYLKGEAPCRDSVVKAIRSGHTIAATGFDEADITLNGYVPGDRVPMEEARNGELHIFAKVMKFRIRKLRIYSGAELICEKDVDCEQIDTVISLKDYDLNQYVRVELEGETRLWVCNSTPFWLI